MRKVIPSALLVLLVSFIVIQYFSDWGNIPGERRYTLLQAMWNNVVEHDIPHKPYALMHRRVELSVTDRKTVGDWLNGRIVAIEQAQSDVD